MRRIAAVLTLLLVGLVALGTPAQAQEARGPLTPAFPCGWRAAPPQTYDHVIWIWFENTSFDQLIGDTSVAPAFNALSRACGTATSYYGLTHPSFRNYIAATSGQDWHGSPATCDPGVPDWCWAPFPSLFSQVSSAGKQWRVYSESMPSNCALTDSGSYEVHHNPAPYYPDIAADCAAWNVPAGTPRSGALSRDLLRDQLAAFSFLVPDADHDMAGTKLTTGDTWLASWMLRILTSRAYLSGSTAVIVTFDEGYGLGTDLDCPVVRDDTCHIPTLVITPSTRPGTTSATYYDHYSLLRATEEMLGLPDYLELAGGPGVTSMRAAFHA